MALIIFINKVRGLYERDEVVINKTTLDEAPSLLQAAGLFTLGIWLFHDGLTLAELDASDVTVALMTTFGAALSGRAVARWLARQLAATERCLIVGETSSVAAVEAKLDARPPECRRRRFAVDVRPRAPLGRRICSTRSADSSPPRRPPRDHRPRAQAGARDA